MKQANLKDMKKEKTNGKIQISTQTPHRQRVTLTYISPEKKVELITKTMHDATDKILEDAKKKYPQLFKQKVAISIDYHRTPFYGSVEMSNPNYTYVIKSEVPKCGTYNFFVNLTCSIVDKGVRFMIYQQPLSILTLDPAINLKAIIKKAKKLVNVDYVLLDRFFCNVACIKVLKDMKVEFILPCVPWRRIKELMQKSEGKKVRIIPNFRLGNTRCYTFVNLVLVNDKNRIKIAIFTNRQLGEAAEKNHFRNCCLASITQ